MCEQDCGPLSCPAYCRGTGLGGPGRRKAAEGRQAEQDSNTGVGGSRRRAADVK